MRAHLFALDVLSSRLKLQQQTETQTQKLFYPSSVWRLESPKLKSYAHDCPERDSGSKRRPKFRLRIIKKTKLDA